MRADRRRAAGLLWSAGVLLQWIGCWVHGCASSDFAWSVVFAVGTVGSGTVVGTTGAVDVTAGCECAGGVPGHSGVAGATLPGEEFSSVGFCFFTASGCLSWMWSPARRYVPPPTTLSK